MLNDLPEQSQCVSHKVWGVLIKAKFLRNFHWLSHQERTCCLPCRPQPWWWPWGQHPSRFWGPPHWSPVLWSQYQPVEFASDLVFTITWTKTRKFLKRRFSKRPDKLISNAIQAKFYFNSIQSLLCLVLTHQVGGERLLLICRHLVNHDVNQLSADGDNQPLISCQTCPWHSCPQ